MNDILVLAHLVGAVTWMGGMGFILAAMRPAAFAVLQPPTRPQFVLATLARFFPLVWLSIALILFSGLGMMGAAGFGRAPAGWHLMFGIGLVMMAVFAWIDFGPYRRARAAAANQDWKTLAASLERIHPLVLLNFTLGWIAIVAVMLWH